MPSGSVLVVLTKLVMSVTVSGSGGMTARSIAPFSTVSCLNNVKTWSIVSEIVLRGGKWFADIGTKTSTGTQVFSLVGMGCNLLCKHCQNYEISQARDSALVWLLSTLM
jgi:hypothetical protein